MSGPSGGEDKTESRQTVNTMQTGGSSGSGEEYGCRIAAVVCVALVIDKLRFTSAQP